METERPVVFVSHVHEDAPLAMAIKEFVDRAFLGMFDVFVSSDGASIRAGDNWSDRTEIALNRAQIVLAVLTPRSLDRRWIYFEAGGAYFSGKRLIPICCAGVEIQHLQPPLSWLQAVAGGAGEGLSALIAAIAGIFGLRVPTIDTAALATTLGYVALPADTAIEKSQLPVQPLFLVLDTSGSMAESAETVLRIAVGRLVALLRLRSVEVTWMLSVITFGTGARLLLPLTSVVDIAAIPEISAWGCADLGAALSLLAREIVNPAVVPRVARSAIVVITSDGNATDDWRRGLSDLLSTSRGAASTRIAVVIGHGADLDVVNRIATAATAVVASRDDEAAMSRFVNWLGTASITESENGSLRFEPPIPQ